MSRRLGLRRVLGEQLLYQLAVALHHRVGGVQDVGGGLACKSLVAVAGRAVQLEQQQPVVPDQLLA
ncbi:hypothetical protein ACFWA9_32105 [Kitasatospora sp. NPDC059973]|uniref:hypothetical protein n=1 Tax=Kitasatospora sp. NPDC059973 TaxID=3347020 RepID=UPI0036890D7A